jgi:arylsulfatase A-like enzyme
MDTYFTGKWHLGEADYALPNAQGYDKMKYAFLYHLNAYTYGDPNWFPDMAPELRAMFDRVTRSQATPVNPQRKISRSTANMLTHPKRALSGSRFSTATSRKRRLDFPTKRLLCCEMTMSDDGRT